MKKKMMSYLLFLVLATAAAAPAAKSDDLPPYLEGPEHKITEREYSDLRSYVERAQKILGQTLEDSTAFSGNDLRNHLLNGIRSALASSDLRGELLLFRYVLQRAQEIDGVYCAENPKAPLAQLSAQVVLLPAIESALGYYQSSDLPRLASNVVPSPNWLEFASEQVPHLLRAVDLAPTKAKGLDLAWKTLGWTARALNSALERRSPEIADLIVRLGELYNMPNHGHPAYLSMAKEAVLAVYKSHMKELPFISTQAPASAGKDLKMRRPTLWRRATTLPVLGLGSNDTIGFDTYTRKQKAYDEKPADSPGLSNDWIMNRVTVTAGAGINLHYGSLNDKGVASPTLTLNSDVYVGGDPFDTDDDHSAYYGDNRGEKGLWRWGFTGVYGKVDATVAKNANGKDLDYNAKFLVTGGVAYVFNVYLAIEKNAFSKFEDSLVSAGWSPQFLVHLGNKEYILIRGIVGAAYGSRCERDPNSERTCSAAGKSVDLSEQVILGSGVVLKKKRLSLDGELTYVSNVFSDSSPSSNRFDANVSLNIPLKLLVRNDVLRLRAQVVDYTNDNLKVGTGMVFYGINW